MTGIRRRARIAVARAMLAADPGSGWRRSCVMPGPQRALPSSPARALGMYGLLLPGEVLRKVYCDNAAPIVRGIAR
jgi:hypothetical protein